jgi:hypothetical protein
MHAHIGRWSTVGAAVVAVFFGTAARAQVVEADGQPLGQNVLRLLTALEAAGAPLPTATAARLKSAADARDAKALQEILDPHVLLLVNINPESRVKVNRGAAAAVIQQSGHTPVIVKVVNEATVTKALWLTSPQAGPIFGGGGADRFGGGGPAVKGRDKAPGNVPPPLRAKPDVGNFLDVSMYTAPPMTTNLSGLKVEYALALIYSSEAGKREATLVFDVGQGTQDIGFRAEAPVLFDIRPAVPVKLSIIDADGKPTAGRFMFKDKQGRIYPPQPKRLAPDFFFHPQIYRDNGGVVLLPPGELTMTYSRGPEYRQSDRKIMVAPAGANGNAAMPLAVKLERWINPMEYGFFSGDHHIHAAGCAHYTNPTEGVHAPDMFLHVKGEGLNVGCNLTWGPCYDYQRQFFEPTIHKVSEPFTILKYDVEVSGFGSQALGHVCLLNLKDQTYPGSEGTKTKGWPTWTTPLMRWAKKQGAVTGYAHSASGLTFQPPDVRAAADRLIAALDTDKDGRVSPAEAKAGLLPDDFGNLDANKDGVLVQQELIAAIDRLWRTTLPNYAIPPMNGIGAQEICVTAAGGLCDFISAMDTARVPEWNCWYHIMNCGYPLKASGETDFPCVSGSRVGQGRVYVHLGKVDRVDFTDWCEGVRAGRSYVSDGYAHALEFKVGGKTPGQALGLTAAGKVTVTAKVAFGAETPLGTSVGGQLPPGKTRRVELIVNGKAVAQEILPADDKVHELTFTVEIERSSWVALRQFPQMHINPVNVIVGDKPIRASRRSALWCIEVIEQLWRARQNAIAADERAEAKKTFDWAIGEYRKIAAESPEDR